MKMVTIPKDYYGQLITALKVIHTWAAYDLETCEHRSLDADHVVKLIDRILRRDTNEMSKM